MTEKQRAVGTRECRRRLQEQRHESPIVGRFVERRKAARLR